MCTRAQVDNRHQEEAKRLYDRNFGIGGDGMCAPFMLSLSCMSAWHASLRLLMENEGGKGPQSRTLYDGLA